jgi:hypothetical protein
MTSKRLWMDEARQLLDANHDPWPGSADELIVERINFAAAHR